MTDFTKYQIRLCRTLHYCEVCNGNIRCDERYYDGGYGRRAHVRCANPEEKKAFEKAENLLQGKHS